MPSYSRGRPLQPRPPRWQIRPNGRRAIRCRDGTLVYLDAPPPREVIRRRLLRWSGAHLSPRPRPGRGQQGVGVGCVYITGSTVSDLIRAAETTG